MQLYFFCVACEHEYLPNPELTQVELIIIGKVVQITTKCPYCGEKTSIMLTDEYQKKVKTNMPWGI